MFDDFKELLSAFNVHNVKYLIIGGYAVSFHAQPRATKDLDLFVQAGPENAKATYAAFVSFGAPLAEIGVDDFADPAKFLRFGKEPVAVDVLFGIDGVNFDEAWARRSQKTPYGCPILRRLTAKGGMDQSYSSTLTL